MSSQSGKNIIRIALFAFLFIIGIALFPKPLKWDEHYGKSSKEPYGTSYLFENLDEIFHQTISTNQSSFYERFDTINDSNTIENGSQNLIVITKSLDLDTLDYTRLLDFVSRGNHCFVASNYFDYRLLDTLRIDMDYDYSYNSDLRDLKTELLPKYERNEDVYEFKKTQFPRSLTYPDTMSVIEPISRIVGQDTSYNYVKIPYGDGVFYLHSSPIIFTNYNLLKPNQSDYIAACLGQLPDQTTIWDEYYKPNANRGGGNQLHVILRYTEVRWAYWCLLSLMLLYLLFKTKRTQRAIPILAPHKNQNKIFIETMGGLHQNHSSNKEIAKKKIKIFRDYIALKHGVHDLAPDDDSMELLAKKSGHDIDLIKRLRLLIYRAEHETFMSNEILLFLNSSINEFYRRS